MSYMESIRDPSEVTSELRGMIVRGELEDGEFLSVRAISRRWGISRRRAEQVLGILTSEGFLGRCEESGFAGFYVRDDFRDGLRRRAELGSIFFAYCAGVLAGRLSFPGRESLRRQLDSHGVLVRGDAALDQAFEAAMGFRLAVMDMVSEQVTGLFVSHGRSLEGPAGFTNTQESALCLAAHERIFSAIESGISSVAYREAFLLSPFAFWLKEASRDAINR